jgi:hypothetical protein
MKDQVFESDFFSSFFSLTTYTQLNVHIIVPSKYPPRSNLYDKMKRRFNEKKNLPFTSPNGILPFSWATQKDISPFFASVAAKAPLNVGSPCNAPAPSVVVGCEGGCIANTGCVLVYASLAGGSSFARIETSPVSYKAAPRPCCLLFTKRRHKNLVARSTNHAGQLAVRVVGVVLGNSTGRADAAEEHDDGNKNESNDDKLAGSRAASTVVGPSTLASAQVLLDLVGSKLVVDEATEGNAVAEELERRDRVEEDHHGGNDEENVLEYTAESHDEAGGPADLLERC